MSILNMFEGSSGDVLYLEKLTKYSEEEQVVGVWTNGKPVYSGTVTGKTPIGNAASAVLLDSTIEELINASGRALLLNNGADDHDWIFPNGAIYPYRRTDGIWMYNSSADNAWFNLGYIMTVEYTKTTDAEGSGWKLLESGVGSSKDVYSTEETVVGTWIDGKPIYKRTFGPQSISLSQTSWKTLSIGVPENPDTIVKCEVRASVNNGDFWGESIQVNFNGGYFQVLYTSNGSTALVVKNLYVTAFYTKTTDQATS